MEQDALDTLPKLVTLNSTTWPSPAPMASLLPRSIYESLLAELATSFFVQASEKGARLRVVAFGTSDRVYEREDSKSIIIFVRGAQSAGPLVPEKPIAIQVGWNLRRYIEPNSDILEFAMSRNPRPPTREAPSSEDSD